MEAQTAALPLPVEVEWTAPKGALPMTDGRATFEALPGAHPADPRSAS